MYTGVLKESSLTPAGPGAGHYQPYRYLSVSFNSKIFVVVRIQCHGNVV